MVIPSDLSRNNMLSNKNSAPCFWLLAKTQGYIMTEDLNMGTVSLPITLLHSMLPWRKGTTLEGEKNGNPDVLGW